jgi:hypothetical protein
MKRRRRPSAVVPPGLLMIMPPDEVSALAAWNADRYQEQLLRGEALVWADEHWAMAILQWKFNTATREMYLDIGAYPLARGGYWWSSYEVDDEREAAFRYWFPRS